MKYTLTKSNYNSGSKPYHPCWQPDNHLVSWALNQHWSLRMDTLLIIRLPTWLRFSSGAHHSGTYSPSTNCWIYISNLPTLLRVNSLSLVEILVIGGQRNDFRMSTVYKGTLYLKLWNWTFMCINIIFVLHNLHIIHNNYCYSVYPYATFSSFARFIFCSFFAYYSYLPDFNNYNPIMYFSTDGKCTSILMAAWLATECPIPMVVPSVALLVQWHMAQCVSDWSSVMKYWYVMPTNCKDNEPCLILLRSVSDPAASVFYVFW